MWAPKAAVAILSTCVVSSLQAAPPETPALPYEDWGACPFECCTYQDWEATRAAVAYQTRSETSKPAFHITAGETIRAENGVVVTTAYGTWRVRKPLHLPYVKKGAKAILSLQPGNLLYTLHYVGEGVYLFWYKGNTYADEVFFPDDDDVEVLSEPTFDWWVKVRNSAGSKGWIKNPTKFRHEDRCE